MAASIYKMPFLYKYNFSHSKLEIASAIPILSEWKIETSNLAAQELSQLHPYYLSFFKLNHSNLH